MRGKPAPGTGRATHARHTDAEMTICPALHRNGRRRATLAALMLLAAATLGCESQTDVRGNIPDPKVLAQIKPGKQTRADVTRMLGAPSTVATFDKETWYYIGGRVKSEAFFKPEILDRQVITVKFDKTGRVAAISKLDATKGRKVTLVDRVTPTKGRELTILQQLLGNIGRFGGQKGGNNDGDGT